MTMTRAEAFLADRFGGAAGDVAPLGMGVWSKAFAFRRQDQDDVIRVGTETSVEREGWTIDQMVVQPCKAPCAYDVNSSGSVDIVDVQLVAGACGADVPAYDFNDTDIVEIFDIQTIAERWRVGC